MFTDLAKDWTAGPPSDYQRFIPMLYAFRLEMHHFELNMYANDHNVIDKPLIKDENGNFSIPSSLTRLFSKPSRCPLQRLLLFGGLILNKRLKFL
jgi:hypothetical protein